MTLVSTEVNTVKHVGTRRHLANEEAGVRNSQVGDANEIQTHIEGLGAEFAFCKLFNVMVDLTTNIRSAKKGEDKGDAMLPNGMVVDVKTTHLDNGRLICAPWKDENNKMDLFCLMTGVFPTYTFRGFYRKDDLFQDINKIQLRNVCYGVTQRQLLTLEEVMALFNQAPIL